jgi:hypothetical protein
MSGVTRTSTLNPSVARLSAARFSSGVLAVAGRLNSANLSGLRRSGLPLVWVLATDLMRRSECCQPKRTSPDLDPPVCIDRTRTPSLPFTPHLGSERDGDIAPLLPGWALLQLML